MKWLDLPALPWKHVAIIAGVAGAVAVVGLLTLDFGPVQGSSGEVMLHRDDEGCIVYVQLNMGGSISEDLVWTAYADKDQCILDRRSSVYELMGRGPLSESIKETKK